jgi:putative ABC transport system permease protein
MAFLIETIRLGLTNLALHKLRSLLTALGIIFGVAAVITMVAIGEGNKLKALRDIQQLGARNIIVRSVKPPEPESSSGGQQRLMDYGIRRRDMRRIEATVSPIDRVVAVKRVGSQVSHGQRLAPAAVFGTTPDLPDVTHLRVLRGRYLTQQDLSDVENVAVIGSAVAERLFPLSDPMEGFIRVDAQLFRVVGVLRPVGLAGGAGTALVGRDLNFDVHIPMTTAASRFGDVNVRRSSGTFEATKVELSELIVEVSDQDQVIQVADQIRLLLEKEHAKAGDTTIIVPLELLEQAERTQRMFNALMTAIAAISLLVGGIGIMNIMLATVTERTREIGIRRALGATRHHIVAQFLVETTVLSALGGLMGVAAGVGCAMSLDQLRRLIPTFMQEMAEPKVTAWSIIVSFVVATTVGIIFGLYPAVKASQQDPIVALRHD